MNQKIIEQVKEYKWQLLLVLLGLGVGLGFLIFHRPASATDQTGLTDQVTPSTTLAQVDDPEKEEEAPQSTWMVDVKGAVAKPGLYELVRGARVNDAIRQAGGFTDQADQKSVNLAQKVTDEAIVYVATKEEGISVLPSATVPTGQESSSSDGKINLNTATEAELQTISGIGAKRAADIVAYREGNGGFHSVEDLQNVSGIGAKTLENLRAYVTVD